MLRSTPNTFRSIFYFQPWIVKYHFLSPSAINLLNYDKVRSNRSESTVCSLNKRDDKRLFGLCHSLIQLLNALMHHSWIFFTFRHLKVTLSRLRQTNFHRLWKAIQKELPKIFKNYKRHYRHGNYDAES